jgi:hypothetical protein
MLLASPTIIRLGWKGLPGTNTLAYYENPQITAVKKFIVQTRIVLVTTNVEAFRPQNKNIECYRT